MSEPRFSPSPWVAFYKNKYAEWHVSVSQEGGGMKLALFADGCPTGEHDARLIATAPDLYTALEEAGDHLMVAARILSSLGHADDGVAMLEARDRNIDLLSKARGELE